MTKFIGRKHEINQLNILYKSNEAKLAVLFGRRRIGKSMLIEQFMLEKPVIRIRFEGLEHGNTQGQIAQCTHDLSQQLNEPLLKNVSLTNWNQLFDYLIKIFQNQKSKSILFLDELQWLACNQSKLVSLIKKYWDQHWSKQNVLLILCGSVSSFMVNKVIHSRALYGRINWEHCLQPLSLTETYTLLSKKRSYDEVMKTVLLLGGIPKYLNELNTNQSLTQNINKLCFTSNGFLVNEYKKIFYSQFREYRIYELIVNYIKNQPHSLNEISKHIKMKSSGGVKNYLENLELASIITSYVPYNKTFNSKLKKYKLTDEYLRFYYQYIAPNQKLIENNQKRNLLNQLVIPYWHSWLGYAFENFCLKNAMLIAEKMGFIDYVKSFGPAFQRATQGFQVDLVFLRTDNVITVCEIKYLNEPIGISVVHEVEKKIKQLHIPRGFTVEKALISRFGIDDALKTLNYFHHVITVKELF